MPGAEVPIIDFNNPKADVKMLEVHRNGECLIAIDYDGSAEFGEHYTPEAAVRVFWESMSGPGAMEIIAKVCAAHGYKVVKVEEDE